MVGFDAEADAQTPEAIFNMRLAYVLVVCGGVGLAAVIVALIPLNQRRMEAVRAELDHRRRGEPSNVSGEAPRTAG